MTIELVYFAVCSAVAGAVFLMAGLWYGMPRLSALPLSQALIPLLLLSAFRVNGLFFLVPGVVAPDIPQAFAVPTAYGDAAAAFLAIAGAFLLKKERPSGVLVAWIYNVVGTLDLLDAFLQTFLHGVQPRHFGAVWFLTAINVPGLLVAHVMMFSLLFRRRRAER
jgi:hypothetical protein